MKTQFFLLLTLLAFSQCTTKTRVDTKTMKLIEDKISVYVKAKLPDNSLYKPLSTTILDSVTYQKHYQDALPKYESTLKESQQYGETLWREYLAAQSLYGKRHPITRNQYLAWSNYSRDISNNEYNVNQVKELLKQNKTGIYN